jgi:hypothetical protein
MYPRKEKQRYIVIYHTEWADPVNLIKSPTQEYDRHP